MSLLQITASSERVPGHEGHWWLSLILLGLRQAMIYRERMLPIILFLAFQLPAARAVLEAEDARSTDITAIERAFKDPDLGVRRLAVRALGRLERPSHAPLVAPFLSSHDAAVRKEALNALGQMRAQVDLTPLLETEKDPAVRAALYETLGRLPQGTEEILLRGLKEGSLEARTGAAKGLECFYRLNSRTTKPSPAATAMLRKTIQETSSAKLRELALLTLNAAGDSDPATLTAALRDADPLVRRLAVAGSKQWRDDPSFMVRYEALKVAGNCERARAALKDPNPHVALLAIDLMGKGCPASPLEEIVDRSPDWRRQAHALVSLAQVSPNSARSRLDRLSRHLVWQARAYGARAARIIKDREALDRLLRDPSPNVVAAALENPRDALQALRTSHFGLIMRATECLKGWSEGKSAVPPLLDALSTVTAQKWDTSRDPRRAILERLREFGDAGLARNLEPYLSDFDPVIAHLAAQIVSEKSRRPAAAATSRLATEPVPPQDYIDGLRGARVRLRMREAGPFTLELLVDEAPVTSAAFARLAGGGYYNGLTFHRVEPNFVIQGGSPGANEYDGSPRYLRDEPGLASHLRDTVGISTRGQDTGDCQIFVNLVDNFRLDHNYTVFARVVEGLDNVDRILEGDTIEGIDILRRSGDRSHNPARPPNAARNP